MTSIFEGQPSKTRPFPIETEVIWVPGIYGTSQSWFRIRMMIRIYGIDSAPLPQTYCILS